jgi:phosphoesterase RecJ-like protein
MRNFHSLNEFKKLLSSDARVVLTAHRNPDGDALGSTLGFKNMLERGFGIKAQIIVPDRFPSFLKYLPDADSVLVFEDNLNECRELIANATIIGCLDYNHPSRTEQMAPFLEASGAVKFMLDHHQNPHDFVDFSWSFVDAGSTCELVCEFMQALDLFEQISMDEAKCLYTGIMTDSGSFRFESTRAETHEIAAHLLRTGLRHWEIHEAIFNQNSYEKLKVWGYALNSKLVYLKEFNTAYIYLDAEELLKYQVKEGDMEGLVNYALSISGVKFGVLFTEKKGMIRISFRSLGDFKVNEFSAKHFGGGGHMNAAGGVSELSMNDTLNKFRNLLPEYSKQLSI